MTHTTPKVLVRNSIPTKRRRRHTDEDKIYRATDKGVYIEPEEAIKLAFKFVRFWFDNKRRGEVELGSRNTVVDGYAIEIAVFGEGIRT